ncbi:MAG TPA: hypothetical protein EYQ00_15580 [Dehalococcoidia bacterium]|nr:hypothetical protein [Dehalococcoidia bacterium]
MLSTTNDTAVDLEDFDAGNVFGGDLTAEVDLSDELGVTPILQDSNEDTPMFTPRSNSRIVRIISKQSNV